MTHDIKRFALFLVSEANYFDMGKGKEGLELLSVIIREFRLCLDGKMKITPDIIKNIVQVNEYLEPLIALKTVNKQPKESKKENKPKAKFENLLEKYGGK